MQTFKEEVVHLHNQPVVSQLIKNIKVVQTEKQINLEMTDVK